MSESHDSPATHFDPKDCPHNWCGGYCDLCGEVQPDRTQPEPTPAEIAEWKRRQAAIDVDYAINSLRFAMTKCTQFVVADSINRSLDGLERAAEALKDAELSPTTKGE